MTAFRKNIKKELALVALIYGAGGVALMLPGNDLQFIGARLLLLSLLFTVGLMIVLLPGGLVLSKRVTSAFCSLWQRIWPDKWRQRTSELFARFTAPETNVEIIEWKELLRPRCFVLPLLLAFAAVTFDFFDQQVFYYLLVLALVFIYCLIGWETKWWTFVLLSIVLIFHGYRCGHDFDNTTYLLFKHWCAFHIIRYGRWYIIPAVLFYIATQRFLFPIGQQGGPAEMMNLFIIYWVVALYVMRFRYGYVFTLFVFMVDLDSSMPVLFTENTSMGLVDTFLTLLPYIFPPLLLFFRKEISHFYKIILLIVVLSSVFVAHKYDYRAAWEEKYATVNSRMLVR